MPLRLSVSGVAPQCPAIDDSNAQFDDHQASIKETSALQFQCTQQRSPFLVLSHAGGGHVHVLDVPVPLHTALKPPSQQPTPVSEFAPVLVCKGDSAE